MGAARHERAGQEVTDDLSLGETLRGSNFIRNSAWATTQALAPWGSSRALPSLVRCRVSECAVLRVRSRRLGKLRTRGCQLLHGGVLPTLVGGLKTGKGIDVPSW